MEGKKILGNQYGYTSDRGIQLLAEKEGNIVSGVFKYSDGKITEFVANEQVIGERLELVDIAFYPKDAKGNELKNEFGGRQMLDTFRAIQNLARSRGYKEVRIHFIRAKKSSSAKPGKVFDKIFDVK